MEAVRHGYQDLDAREQLNMCRPPLFRIFFTAAGLDEMDRATQAEEHAACRLSSCFSFPRQR
jgi:hypothetical protein